jgi:glutaredoxin
VPSYELFGTSSCSYTRDMREWLEWRGYDYEEYDVEADSAALARMIAIAGGQRTMPILVKDGGLVQVGWQGRGCVVSG